MDWLLAYAVGLVYGDNSNPNPNHITHQTRSLTHDPHTSTPISAHTHTQGQLFAAGAITTMMDVDHTETAAAAGRLAKALKFPTAAGNLTKSEIRSMIQKLSWTET